MAKKSNQQQAAAGAKASTGSVKERDARTQRKIEDLALDIVKRALAGREPVVEIPTRTKSNFVHGFTAMPVVIPARA